MDVVYALAGLIGVAGVLFAAVNIIYPIKRLGIPTRKRAVLVLIASFSLAIVAAALDESAEQSDQSVEVQPPPGGVADEANTVADNSASKTTNKVSAADPTPDEFSRTGSVSSNPIQDGQTDSSSTSRNTIDSRVYTVVAEKDHSFGNVRSRVTLEIEARGATTERAQIETMMNAAIERHRKDWPDAVSVRLWGSYGADQVITNSIDYAADGCGWTGDDCTGRIWAKPHKGSVPAELTEWGTPTDGEREAGKDLQCRQDLQCWGDKHLLKATFACQPMIENLAKYDYEWTDGWLEAKLQRFRWKDRKTGTLSYTGNRVKFQNGFGAWQRITYWCHFDPATGFSEVSVQ